MKIAALADEKRPIILKCKKGLRVRSEAVFGEEERVKIYQNSQRAENQAVGTRARHLLVVLSS